MDTERYQALMDTFEQISRLSGEASATMEPCNIDTLDAEDKALVQYNAFRIGQLVHKVQEEANAL